MTTHRTTRTARPPLAAVAVSCLVLAAALDGPAHEQPPSQPEAACTDHDHDHATDHDHDHATDHDHDLVVLSSAVQREFGLTTAVAGPAVIHETVRVPGEVRLDADRLVRLAPRYEGTVVEVFAGLGDRVQVGQTLAVIENDATLAPYRLQAPRAGTVIAKDLAVGEAVGRDDPLYVIADLDRVWIDLAVFPRELQRVRLGQRVRFPDEDGGAAAEGVIGYLTPTVDPRTRAATARVVLPNADGRWRPGQILEAAIELAVHEAAVAVPGRAIQTVEGLPAVFVLEDGGFRSRAVQPGPGDRDRVAILSGLEAAEVVVVDGAFVLKAELEKHAFAHCQDH